MSEQNKELQKINATCGEIVSGQGIIYDQKAKIGTASGTQVAGGEQAPIADPDERDGWLFVKALADTAKFNYYFYGQGNLPITLGDITSIWANISIDVWAETLSEPFINIFTKPTGAGDAGAWYHSKIVCGLQTGEHIILGQTVRAWAYSKPEAHTNRRQVSFNNRTTTGDGLPAEEILYITIHSDSGAPAGTQILVESVGYTMYGRTNNPLERIDRQLALIA